MLIRPDTCRADLFRGAIVSWNGVHSVQNDRVWDLIEEARDIGVKHVPAAGSVDFRRTFERHVAEASRPEAVRIVVQQPLEQWTEQSARHFLCRALTHGRDTRRPRDCHLEESSHAERGVTGRFPA